MDGLTNDLGHQGVDVVCNRHPGPSMRVIKETKSAAADYLSPEKADRLGSLAHPLLQTSNSSWIRTWDRFGHTPRPSPQR